MQPICSIRFTPSRRVWLLAAFHAVGIAAAMLAAFWLRLGWSDGLNNLVAHHVTVSGSLGIFLVALGTAGIYDGSAGLGKTLTTATVALVAGTLLATALLWTMAPWLARGVLPVFAVLALLVVFAIRLTQRLVQRLGFMTTRCLLIGTNGDARKTIDLIHRHPDAGVQVVGIIHCGSEPGVVGTLIGDYPVLGTDVSLSQLIRLHRVDRLIVATPSEIEAPLLRRLRSFRYRGVDLSDYVSLHEELTQEISIEHINDEWLLAASMSNSRPHIRRSKRVFDIVAAFGGLVLTAPITALAALLIKLDSPGPVLYGQERLGRDGVAFRMFKFRTMAVDAESHSGPVWACEDDSRITRVGRWLRKTRIDEVPQLINVLRGEMSMVGPRPERKFFVKQLEEQVPFYTERLMVHPGVTGWAQVMQSYASSIEESRRKLQADLYYIKHMSLMTDLYILQKTVKVVLSGHERSRPVQGVGANGDAVAPAPVPVVAAASLPRIILRSRPQRRTSSLVDGRRVARTQ